MKKALLEAGAMVIVQDGYRAATTHDLYSRAAVGEVYCMTSTPTKCTELPEGAITGIDEKGNYQVDMSKADPKVPAVGLKDHTKLFNEGNPVMTGLSRVPGMQAMAVFHDQWAISWDMGALATSATILPAIVITYVGTGAPYYASLRQTALDNALNQGKPGCCSPDEKASDTSVEPIHVKDSARPTA